MELVDRNGASCEHNFNQFGALVFNRTSLIIPFINIILRAWFALLIRRLLVGMSAML